MALAISCLALAGLAFAAGTAVAGRDGATEKKIPKEAESAFGGIATAFRRADAAGTIAFAAQGKDDRVVLHLTGLSTGSYTREQAAEALANTYFAHRKVVSLVPAECCTTGDDSNLARTYRLRVRIGESEREGTLTIEIVRRKNADDEYRWFLKSLKDS